MALRRYTYSTKRALRRPKLCLGFGTGAAAPDRVQMGGAAADLDSSEACLGAAAPLSRAAARPKQFLGFACGAAAPLSGAAALGRNPQNLT